MDRLQTMKAFVHVVDECGFTAAARKLGVDQALITRQIADLEQHLGTKLLERTTRTVRLTEAGEIFLPRCRVILADLSEAEEEVSRSSEEMAGRVRIGLPTVFDIHETAQALTQLHQEFPDLTVELAMSDAAIDPVAEGFDVATMNTAHPVSANAVARPLLDATFIICAAPSYLQRHPAPRSPADLAAHYCVGGWIAGGANYRRESWTLQSASGEPETVTIPVALRTNTYTLSLEAVRCGIGIGLLPKRLVAEDLSSQTLLPLLSEWQTVKQSYQLVYPGRRLIPRRVRHVIDTIFSQRDEGVIENKF